MRRLSVVVALLATAGCLAAVGFAAPASAGCDSGYVCTWTEINYLGVQNDNLCTTGTHQLAHYKHSAQNRCANKKNFLRIRGSDVQTCMDPGGNRPIPIEFNDVDVGAEGSRC